jgi:hypothetical protein
LVRDLGSKNGASLGDARLPAGKDVPWPPSERLRVGQNLLSYEDPVSEALAELERAADERMRDDDLIDSPNASQEPATAEPAAGEGPLPNHTDVSSRGAPPIAKVPKKQSAREPRARQGWTVTDVAIALIAITVLGVSVLGLIWLFKAT